ncbi:MAG: collagen-like protein [Patescibacteria group bacterium]
MKKYIVFSVIALVVGVSVASAQGGGNPWDAIWKAITELQNKIDNIVLTPGPVGPQGPQGIQGLQGEIGPIGSQGPQGESGSSGTSFYLIDANGQNLGKLLSIDNLLDSSLSYSSVATYVTYLSDLGVALRFLEDKSKKVELKATNKVLYYDEVDCTGIPYVDGSLMSQRLYRDDTRHTPFFVATEDAPVINLNSLSYTATGTAPWIINDCISSTSTPFVVPTAYRSQEVTLPFTEPLAGPFRIIE